MRYILILIVLLISSCRSDYVHKGYSSTRLVETIQNTDSAKFVTITVICDSMLRYNFNWLAGHPRAINKELWGDSIDLYYYNDYYRRDDKKKIINTGINSSNGTIEIYYPTE